MLLILDAEQFSKTTSSLNPSPKPLNFLEPAPLWRVTPAEIYAMFHNINLPSEFFDESNSPRMRIVARGYQDL